MTEAVLPGFETEKSRSFPRPAGERCFEVSRTEDFLRWVRYLKDENYYLIHLTANDETSLEVRAPKIYATFCGGNPSQLIILGYPVEQTIPDRYPGLHDLYPSALALEAEIFDMFGLSPQSGLKAEDTGLFLHRSAFPAGLAPLRQTFLSNELRKRLGIDLDTPEYLKTQTAPGSFSVGPIHARIIGGGLFLFTLNGKEEIEDVNIVLGFQHRGVEKIAEEEYSLLDGWKLAERVAGDTSYAYGLAHCQAVEALGAIPVPLAAQAWRALLLETERITHHTGDLANSLDGISASLYSNRLSLLQEALFQLAQRITVKQGENYLENENFLLRGINQVGGVCFASLPDFDDIARTIQSVTDEVIRLSQLGLENKDCRNRFEAIGILRKAEAGHIGATGLAARASGLTEHDFRLLRPEGAFADETLNLQGIIRATVSTEANLDRKVLLYPHDLKGDAFSRLRLRAAEIESSALIIQVLIRRLKQLGPAASLATAPDAVSERLGDDALARLGYKFGLGFSESWRGEVVCQVWPAPGAGIFRYSLRDPSVYNWLAMRWAVRRKIDTGESNILADFPAINKSFNNSYPGVSK